MAGKEGDRRGEREFGGETKLGIGVGNGGMEISGFEIERRV